MQPPAASAEGPGRTSVLIRAARAGSAEALGRLLEGCRAYLLLIANQHLAPVLRGKAGGSDLVQETFLEAQHDFGQFQGRTRDDLLAWLRGILLHNLADFNRRFRSTAARQIAQERDLDAPEIRELHQKLVADTPGPPERAAAAEEIERLRQKVVALPEDYRQVLMLRHVEGRSFPEIARMMGRSTGAVQKLWFRAVEVLRQEMRPPHEPGASAGP